VTIGSPGPLPSYQGVSNATDPPIPPPDPGDGSLVEVFLTVAIRCSDGTGSGVHHVGAAEAQALVNSKMAIYGSRPPRGWNLPVS
jgi:hypothetical protein